MTGTPIDVTGAPGQINFPFTAAALGDEIDRIPTQWGLVNALDILPEEGVGSTLVEISFRDGQISLLPTSETGSPGSVARVAGEKKIWLEIPHIEHSDTVKPADLQNRQAFGVGQRRPRTLEDEVAKRLFDARLRFDITFEFMKVGALRGQIYDGAGVLLYDLFQVFGVQRKTISFELNNSATNVREKTYEVSRHQELNLFGEVMTGTTALCSPEFFGAFSGHANVEKFYLNWNSGAGEADLRKGFKFGSMTFVEYQAVAPDTSGTPHRFIEPGKAYAIPRGTRKTFRTYLGPADQIGATNKNGRRIYVSPEVLKHGKGVELLFESNPLPLCERPGLLVELTV